MTISSFPPGVMASVFASSAVDRSDLWVQTPDGSN